MARAKELLDLIASPTAVATGVLLTFARAQLTRNGAGTIDRGMTFWALLASCGATVIAGAIVVIMTPLAVKVTAVNRGGVETRLLVYGLTYLVAIGTAGYAGFITWKCVRDLT